MHMRVLFAILLVAIGAPDPRAAAQCFSIVAGREATADGSVLFGHNEDNGLADPCGLVAVPRKEHGEGEWISFAGGARIRQERVTFAYWWLRMPGLLFSDALLNEHGVAVSTNNCPSREDRPALTDGGVGGPLLRRLVAERARTAREGVELVGSLIERFGYSPSGRTMVIADPREGWFVAMVQGKHWIAARVPDDEVALIANTYTIGAIDLAEKKNFLGSPDIVDYARERGWYDPAAGAFRFEAAYAHRGTRVAASNTHRQWSGLQRVSAQPVEPPERVPLPFSVKPKARLTIEDLKAVLRDHYEGTGLRERASYRDKPPHRGGERPICVPQTNASSIFVLRSRGAADLSRVWWLALWQPCSTPYVPLYPGVQEVPAVLALRDEGFSPAYQALSDLARWVDEDYAGRIPAVRECWRDWEARLAEWERRADSAWPAEGADTGEARRKFVLALDMFPEHAVREARRLMGAAPAKGEPRSP